MLPLSVFEPSVGSADDAPTTHNRFVREPLAGLDAGPRPTADDARCVLPVSRSTVLGGRS